MHEFCDVFKAFLNEALFTKEILGLGATQIRKANYASKGIYYEAFTCLSTGMERIGKLCVLLDYYIDNNGKFPNVEYVKNEIGHNLIKLYGKSKDIAKNHNVQFRFKSNLDEEIYTRILQILSRFAVGDRYSNINILAKKTNQRDPMSLWHCNIDNFIYEKYISDKKKTQIEENANLINAMTGGLIFVQHISESGNIIADVKKASKMTGIQQAVAPYRQLFILQMIRYWAELLNKLGDIAQTINKDQFEIPYFSEIFGGFYNSDSYLKSRKTWDKI